MDGNCADEEMHLLEVSCIGNPLLGKNYLRRATLPPRKCPQKTLSGIHPHDGHLNDPTIPY